MAKVYLAADLTVSGDAAMYRYLRIIVTRVNIHCRVNILCQTPSEVDPILQNKIYK